MPRSAAAEKFTLPKGEAAGSLRVWLQLMKTTKALEALAGGHLKRRHGQSLARFDVLSQLHRFETPWINTGELAGSMMTARTNITGLLDRMEAEGLIARRPSPTDRRSSQVRATPAGARLFCDMTLDHADWIAGRLGAMSDADKTNLVDLLVRLRRILEAQPSEGGRQPTGRHVPTARRRRAD